MSSGPEIPFPRPISVAPVERAPSFLVPARVPIEGRTVVLEPLDAARHAGELWEAARDAPAALWDYLPYGPYGSEAEMAGQLHKQSAAFDPVFYAIRPRGTGRATGHASYLEIFPDHGAIEIGHIWFGPALQRTTEATEALFLMVAHAMDGLGYRRMQWKCDAANAGSRSAARRLGFRFEGVLHAARIVKGRNRDTAYYSILGEEWPELRAIFEAWLDPANFDGEGRARRSLSEMMAGREPGCRR